MNAKKCDRCKRYYDMPSFEQGVAVYANETGWNNERREAARRLRETGEELGSSALLWYHIAKALGVRTATDGKTACGMLADLIEPPLQCPHYHSDIHYCSIREDIQLIDREALLELSDECDSVHMHKVARRIREALGAQE